MVNAPYAAANFTASIGVKLSAVLPPMVPLIPDIDFINVILFSIFLYSRGKGKLFWLSSLLKGYKKELDQRTCIGSI